MAWDKNLTPLREVFADLYEKEVDARRVAGEADLNVGNVTFSAQANNNWYAILGEAEKQGKVESLIDIGIKEYPRNGPLLLAVETYHSKQGYLAEAQLTALTALATQAQLSGRRSAPASSWRISGPCPGELSWCSAVCRRACWRRWKRWGAGGRGG